MRPAVLMLVAAQVGVELLQEAVVAVQAEQELLVVAVQAELPLQIPIVNMLEVLEEVFITLLLILC